MPIAPTVELTPEQRAILKKWARARSLPARVVERACIVLRAAAGEANKEIAQAMGVTRQTVSNWRKRFLAMGLPGLEKDVPGKKSYSRSRKPGFRGEQARARRAIIVRLRTVEGWTLQEIADFCGVSRQRVHQVLEEANNS